MCGNKSQKRSRLSRRHCQTRFVHCCSAGLHVHGASLENCLPVAHGEVLHTLNSGRRHASKNNGLANDVGFFSRDPRRTVSPPAVSGVPVRPPTMCERSCTCAQLASTAGINKAMTPGTVFTAAHPPAVTAEGEQKARHRRMAVLNRRVMTFTDACYDRGGI